ncbi:hypothetical protein NIES4073_18480 [Kalymmatonema gypsitolerans NIES-4073]|nr:hypothetical protein NIES4073_18480 [Scytonema sp. NIES-4073]
MTSQKIGGEGALIVNTHVQLLANKHLTTSTAEMTWLEV